MQILELKVAPVREGENPTVRYTVLRREGETATKVKVVEVSAESKDAERRIVLEDNEAILIEPVLELDTYYDPEQMAVVKGVRPEAEKPEPPPVPSQEKDELKSGVTPRPVSPTSSPARSAGASVQPAKAPQPAAPKPATTPSSQADEKSKTGISSKDAKEMGPTPSGTAVSGGRSTSDLK